jgi:primosomal protein N'
VHAGTSQLRRRRPRNEFRCADCGYGAIAAYEPPRCPLCGGSSWQSVGGGASRSRGASSPSGGSS